MHHVNDMSLPGSANRWCPDSHVVLSVHMRQRLCFWQAPSQSCGSCRGMCCTTHDTAASLACRAKQLLPFFQRSGKVAGVVEFVLSGHRLKVGSPAPVESLPQLRISVPHLMQSTCQQVLVRANPCVSKPAASHTCTRLPDGSIVETSNVQVYVPKEGVTVLFCPSGVRAPQRGSAMGRDGRPVAVRSLACYFVLM